MRLLLDMDNRSEVGYIDWEFIHDMQGIAPDMITPELIYLNHDFLGKIPPKWENIKTLLLDHIVLKKTVHLAISDIENMGNEFKVRGVFKNKKGEVLSFHKVVIYDKDRFEDDYLGAVITDKNGKFTLSFGKKVFSDFGAESEPDIYFRVFAWKENRFVEIGKIMPDVFEKTITNEHTLMEFGMITL